MISQEAQENIKKIEAIYAEFERQLHQLKGNQQAILSKFIEHLENAKLDQIRKTISNKQNE